MKKKALKTLRWQAGAIFALLVLLGAGITSSQGGFQSSELHFTDASKGGLQIVPASCTSDPNGQCSNCVPPTVTQDGRGYILAAGSQIMLINAQGYTFCVSNNTSNSYFVPINSTNEIRSFYNANISGLSKVPAY